MRTNSAPAIGTSRLKTSETFADCPFFPNPALSPTGRGKKAQKVLEYLCLSPKRA
jgi:hypothetical protein